MEINEHIEEMDVSLLLRYINETATSVERSQVDAWLVADKTNEDTILQLARIYYAKNTQERILQRDPYLAWEKVEQQITRKSRKLLFRKIAVAASLIIGVLGIGSFFLQQKNTRQEMITVSTNAGMRSQMELPDGTIVYLNANSTLIYPVQYDKNKRKVQLSGEAYFNVAHNPKKPFVVTTSDNKVNIRVLGTKFNLQAYEKDQRIQTTLVEGSVRLGFEGKKGEILMTPSDQVVYDLQTKQILQRKANTAQETAWKDGRLIFRDTPMPDVLRQLSHFYSVEFDIKDKIIYDYTFTGMFENRPLFQILDYMKISSKINYQMVYPQNKEERKPVIIINKIK